MPSKKAPKPSTAQNGDPASASRGAAVRREKEGLRLAIKARIEQAGEKFNQTTYNAVLRVLGPKPGKTIELSRATLRDLNGMRMKLTTCRDDVLKEVCTEAKRPKRRGAYKR